MEKGGNVSEKEIDLESLSDSMVIVGNEFYKKKYYCFVN